MSEKGHERIKLSAAQFMRSRFSAFHERPLNHAGADAEFSADLEDALTVGPQPKYPRLYRRPDLAPS
jgi:hypothetical protein